VRSARSVGTALLASLSAAVATAGDTTGLRTASERFYQTYLKTKAAGVPVGDDLARYRAVVSSGLAALLERAGAAEAEYARRTRNESPPLVEGDLFTSLFEGASRYLVEGCQPKAPGGTCRVALTYLDRAGGKPVEWTDTVVLVKESGGWRVSDIEFGGTWEFMHAGRLVGLLESVIAAGQGP